MNDLISRQALKEKLDEHYQLLNDDERFEQCDAYVDFDYLIDSMPTAYSVDKVLEELEDYSMWKDFMIYDLTYRERKIIERAIEIVKRGGRNEID